MPEAKLEIVQNGEYKNLELKEKFKVIDNQKQTVSAGIPDGDYVIVTKEFAEGLEVNGKFGPSYSCKVTYDGNEGCSFWLKPKEHDAYKSCGGVGDRIKISMAKKPFVMKNGAEMTKQELSFEKVE
jgi:hypothetical protein